MLVVKIRRVLCEAKVGSMSVGVDEQVKMKIVAVLFEIFWETSRSRRWCVGGERERKRVLQC